MLKFREQTRDRIASELASGKAPAAWAYALQQNSDPYFIPAVQKLFRAQGCSYPCDVFRLPVSLERRHAGGDQRVERGL